MESSIVSLRVPTKNLQKLDKYAEQMGKTRTDIINFYLEEALLLIDKRIKNKRLAGLAMALREDTEEFIAEHSDLPTLDWRDE